jgi:hypothetical protein
MLSGVEWSFWVLIFQVFSFLTSETWSLNGLWDYFLICSCQICMWRSLSYGVKLTHNEFLGPGAHPVSCTMGTGSWRKKAAGTWRWPSLLLVPRSKNRVEIYLCSPERPSWPVKRVKPTMNYCMCWVILLCLCWYPSRLASHLSS